MIPKDLGCCIEEGSIGLTVAFLTYNARRSSSCGLNLSDEMKPQ